MPIEPDAEALREQTDGEFLHDVAARMFRTVTPMMGFDQGDIDRLHRIARALTRAPVQPSQGVEYRARCLLADAMQQRDPRRAEWLRAEPWDRDHRDFSVYDHEIELLAIAAALASLASDGSAGK